MNQDNTQGQTPVRRGWLRKIFSDTSLALMGMVLGGFGTWHSCYTYQQQASTAALNHLFQIEQALSASPPDLSTAREQIAKMVELDNSSPEAIAMQARFFEAQGDANLAEATYKRALNNDASAQLANFYYGKFLVNRGEVVAGVERLKQARAQTDSPAIDNIYLSRAEISLAIGEAYLAAEGLENRLRFARDACEEAEGYSSTAVRALLCVGDAHSEENNNSAANAYYRRAEELVPDDPDVLRRLGWSYRLLGRYSEAEQKLRAALAIRSDTVTESLLRITLEDARQTSTP